MTKNVKRGLSALLLTRMAFLKDPGRLPFALKLISILADSPGATVSVGKEVDVQPQSVKTENIVRSVSPVLVNSSSPLTGESGHTVPRSTVSEEAWK